MRLISIKIKKSDYPPPVFNTKPFTLYECFPNSDGKHILPNQRDASECSKNVRTPDRDREQLTDTRCAKPIRELITATKTKLKRDRYWRFRFSTYAESNVSRPLDGLPEFLHGTQRPDEMYKEIATG